jgi:hypothetical protein
MKRFTTFFLIPFLFMSVLTILNISLQKSYSFNIIEHDKVNLASEDPFFEVDLESDATKLSDYINLKFLNLNFHNQIIKFNYHFLSNFFATFLLHSPTFKSTDLPPPLTSFQKFLN